MTCEHENLLLDITRAHGVGSNGIALQIAREAFELGKTHREPPRPLSEQIDLLKLVRAYHEGLEEVAGVWYAGDIRVSVMANALDAAGAVQ